jgi:hypothetical protein
MVMIAFAVIGASLLLVDPRGPVMWAGFALLLGAFGLAELTTRLISRRRRC